MESLLGDESSILRAVQEGIGTSQEPGYSLEGCIFHLYKLQAVRHLHEVSDNIHIPVYGMGEMEIISQYLSVEDGVITGVLSPFSEPAVLLPTFVFENLIYVPPGFDGFYQELPEDLYHELKRYAGYRYALMNVDQKVQQNYHWNLVDVLRNLQSDLGPELPDGVEEHPQVVIFEGEAYLLRLYEKGSGDSIIEVLLFDKYEEQWIPAVFYTMDDYPMPYSFYSYAMLHIRDRCKPLVFERKADVLRIISASVGYRDPGNGIFEQVFHEIMSLSESGVSINFPDGQSITIQSEHKHREDFFTFYLPEGIIKVHVIKGINWEESLSKANCKLLGIPTTSDITHFHLVSPLFYSLRYPNVRYDPTFPFLDGAADQILQLV